MSGPLLWLGVGVAGGAGALARYAVDSLIGERARTAFPLGILIVNLSGSLVLGFLAGLTLDHDEMLLLGTAVVGSYTTFSTWMVDTHGLAAAGDRRHAVANVVVSVAAGLLAAELGRRLGGA